MIAMINKNERAQQIITFYIKQNVKLITLIDPILINIE